MKYFCYHTHTSYCDGKGEPFEFVEKAIELGMSAIGFSGHTPLPFDNKWSMDGEDFLTYCEEIRGLSLKYKDKIDVYLSLELDYLPGKSFMFEQMKSKGNLDYTIGSVHLVSRPGREGLWFLDGPDTNYINGLDSLFDGDIQMAVTRYYELIQSMLITQKPDVVGHIDKVRMNNKGRFFSEDDQWYRRLVSKTLDQVALSGAIVEVNTRGIYKKKSPDLFPNEPVLKECLKRNISVTISADAHHPDELLGCFDQTRVLLRDIGYSKVMIFTANGWEEESL